MYDSMNMTSQNIGDYLKRVATLEASIFSQENTISSLFREEPKKKEISLSKPEAPAAFTGTKVPGLKVALGILLGLFLALFGAYAYYKTTGTRSMIFLGVGVLGLLLTVFTILFTILKNGKYHSHNKAVAKYNKDLETYNKAIEEEEKRYTEELNAFNSQKQATIMKLRKCLYETQSLLNQYYDMDILSSNYQNLVAVSSMYEYLKYRRCSELAGPGGAYETYDSELKQEIVIDDLDKIRENPESIEKYQTYLYELIQDGIKDRDELIAGIKELVDEAGYVSTRANEISTCGAVDSYCSKILKTNSDLQLVKEL